MICYKDRSYCVAKCMTKECARNLSKEEQQHALELGLPIALTDFSSDCDSYVPEDNKEIK